MSGADKIVRWSSVGPVVGVAAIAAVASYARWAGEAGDAAGARDQFAALLPIRERVSGPDHPSTVAVRHNLARSTGKAGQRAN
jgi:hypothetical protein